MDTPAPIAIKSKEYSLKSDDKTFKIRLNLSSKINIEANEIEKIKGVFYSNIFSLENLVKLSKGFKICEDINEAFDIIVQIFENQKANIKYNNENEVILIIKVALPGGNFHDVNLPLNKKEMNKELLIDELILKVNKLEEENKSIKKDLNELKELKEKVNLFEKYFADEIKNKKMIEEIGIDSKIIDKKEDLQFIYERLVNNNENLKQKKIKFNLLYRATRDGDNSNIFHNKVDNKNSILSIIQTNKGIKFGFYKEQPYKNTGKSQKDNNLFIFNLNLKKIYNTKEGAFSFNDIDYNIINLYNQPICIGNNCLTNNESYTCTKSKADVSFYGFEKDYELNNYEQKFTVQEIETFQISFN